MSIELKIKAKSLGAESQMIRKEEIKLKRSARWNDEHQKPAEAAKFQTKRRALYEHRVQDVRFESRATHLARAYIAGKPYKSIERSTRDDADTKTRLWKRVHTLLKKYHNPEITQAEVLKWFEG